MKRKKGGLAFLGGSDYERTKNKIRIGMFIGITAWRQWGFSV